MDHSCSLGYLIARLTPHLSLLPYVESVTPLHQPHRFYVPCVHSMHICTTSHHISNPDPRHLSCYMTQFISNHFHAPHSSTHSKRGSSAHVIFQHHSTRVTHSAEEGPLH